MTSWPGTAIQAGHPKTRRGPSGLQFPLLPLESALALYPAWGNQMPQDVSSEPYAPKDWAWQRWLSITTFNNSFIYYGFNVLLEQKNFQSKYVISILMRADFFKIGFLSKSICNFWWNLNLSKFQALGKVLSAHELWLVGGSPSLWSRPK